MEESNSHSEESTGAVKKRSVTICEQSIPSTSRTSHDNTVMSRKLKKNKTRSTRSHKKIRETNKKIYTGNVPKKTSRKKSKKSSERKHARSQNNDHLPVNEINVSGANNDSDVEGARRQRDNVSYEGDSQYASLSDCANSPPNYDSDTEYKYNLLAAYQTQLVEGISRWFNPTPERQTGKRTLERDDGEASSDSEIAQYTPMKRGKTESTNNTTFEMEEASQIIDEQNQEKEMEHRHNDFTDDIEYISTKLMMLSFDDDVMDLD